MHNQNPERAVFINRAAAEAFMQGYAFCNAHVRLHCYGITERGEFKGYGVTIVRNGGTFDVVTESIAARYTDRK